MKKIRFVTFPGLVLLLCGLFACGKGQDDKARKPTPGFEEDLTTQTEEWVTFRAKDFSLKFPPIFIIDTSGYMRTRLILSTTSTGDEDNYSDNIKVYIAPLEKPMTLEKYGKKSEKDILQYTEKPEILQSELKHKNGRDYYLMIYSEDQSTYRLIREQHIMLKDNILYIVTLSCEDAVFDQCREVGEGILSTFQIE